MFIHSNGDVKKVAACKVKPYELKERKEESKEGRIEKSDWNEIIEKEEKSRPEEVREDEQTEKEEESENEKDESEEQDNEKEVEDEKLKDVIGAKYLKMEKSICFFGEFSLCGRSSSERA